MKPDTAQAVVVVAVFALLVGGAGCALVGMIAHDWHLLIGGLGLTYLGMWCLKG